MIIVLKDADFSANNIGKVNVDEINEFTLAAIAASGNNDMTENQVYALNSFFKTIGAWDEGDNTIFKRMNCIMLPILSKDKAHAFINYTDNLVLKNSSGNDITPSSEKVIMRNHGVAATDFTVSVTGAKIQRVWTGEFSLMWLRTEKFTKDCPTDINTAIYVREQPSTNDLVYIYETRNSLNTGSQLGASGIKVSGDYVFTSFEDEVIGAQGITLRSAGDAYSIINGLGQSRNWSLNGTPFTPGDNSWFETRVFGMSKYNDVAAMGVVMFGKAMTNAEMDAVASAINGLRDAFLV